MSRAFLPKIKTPPGQSRITTGYSMDTIESLEGQEGTNELRAKSGFGPARLVQNRLPRAAQRLNVQKTVGFGDKYKDRQKLLESRTVSAL